MAACVVSLAEELPSVVEPSQGDHQGVGNLHLSRHQLHVLNTGVRERF